MGYLMIEGSLEVKLPTIWTDGKAEVGRVREEAKAAGAKPSGEMRDKKCTPLWPKHISKSKS
jgi:hypothetical protein